MEPPSSLISRVNPFPSRFINRTVFFCNAIESHECACCLLFDVRQYIFHFSILGVKPPQVTRSIYKRIDSRKEWEMEAPSYGLLTQSN